MDTSLNNNNNDSNDNKVANDTLSSLPDVTSTGFLGSGTNGEFSYHDIQETKTYYPSVEEFASPLRYIESIRDEAMQYGIIKIKPPKEWNPSFNLSRDDFKFSTKVQPIHLIEKRYGGGSLSSFSLDELRSGFVANLRVFLREASVDNVRLNDKLVFLYDLYVKITQFGGYHKANTERAIWKSVATELGVDYRANGHSSQQASNLVKQTYELYLLDYEQAHYFPAVHAEAPPPPPQHEQTEPQTAAHKFEHIMSSKAEQIAQHIVSANGDDVDTLPPSCSVCGDGHSASQWDASNIILECVVCGNRWHSHCHEPPVAVATLQMLLARQQQEGTARMAWMCTSCELTKKNGFGYRSSGTVYSLAEYEEKAQQFKRTFLNAIGMHKRHRTNGDDEAPSHFEHLFWSIVDNGCYPLTVEYGSEIPSTKENTGFPMTPSPSPATTAPGLDYASHEFNLMNICKAQGNILQHLGRDISGMTYPWIYVGMFMSCFAWHYEDHYAYSVNYQHCGADKQWYGIPGLYANDAEQAMNAFLKQHNCGAFSQFDLTTMVSPLLLHKVYGLPVYKARQHAGEFVVTFPQAYHCGFNTGFNVNEAVNFATADWLSFGLKCVERYRVFGRRQAFSHDELICRLCEKLDTLDERTLQWLFENFLFAYKSHYAFIKTMLSANVTRGRPWEYDPKEWIKIGGAENDANPGTALLDNLHELDVEQLGAAADGTGRMKYDDNNWRSQYNNEDDEDEADDTYWNVAVHAGITTPTTTTTTTTPQAQSAQEPARTRPVKWEDAECVQCKHCLFLCCVRCKCDPSVVCCARHFAQFCQCPIANKWFEFRYDLSWFERTLQQLQRHCHAQLKSVSGLSSCDYGAGDVELHEWMTPLSDKNYEVLTKATDDAVYNVCLRSTAAMARSEFEERYGQILGDYSLQLVRKLADRFPHLPERKMSSDELNHLRHACECVVWGHFNHETANTALAQVRGYFVQLCDWNAVSKLLYDAWRCYSDVQQFYSQLTASNGQQDKIEQLLANQPRFPKKLSLRRIETALLRVQNGEIRVEMQTISNAMPEILTFMRQQEQILQNGLCGILRTTWQCQSSLNVQARQIVNFIPGNFAQSYWSYLQSHIPKVLQPTNGVNAASVSADAPATLEDKNTCLVLPILKWLLGEFERGILASIDCSAMNSLKRVLHKGTRLLIVVQKYYHNKDKHGECWLRESKLKRLIRNCNQLQLRLPFWEFVQKRNNDFVEWKKRSTHVLRKSHAPTAVHKKQQKCSFEMLKELLEQYGEYRVLHPNGNVLKSLIAPLAKWVNRAKELLLRVLTHASVDDGEYDECHALVLEFEQFTHVVTQPPSEYHTLLTRMGVTQWAQQVRDMLLLLAKEDEEEEACATTSVFVVDDVDQVRACIEQGTKYRLQSTQQLVDRLQRRLDELLAFYAQCDEKLSAVRSETGSQRKQFDLCAFQALIGAAHELRIDVPQNSIVQEIEHAIRRISEWQLNVSRALDALPFMSEYRKQRQIGMQEMETTCSTRKRTLSQFQSEHADDGDADADVDAVQQRRCKRRRRNKDDVPVLAWHKKLHVPHSMTALPLIDENVDYKELRAQRRRADVVMTELQAMVHAGADIPAQSELEREAKDALLMLEECAQQCQTLVASTLRGVDAKTADTDVLMAMDIAQVNAVKNTAGKILKQTVAEFEVSALQWRWHALWFLKRFNERKQTQEPVELPEPSIDSVVPHEPQAQPPQPETTTTTTTETEATATCKDEEAPETKTPEMTTQAETETQSQPANAETEETQATQEKEKAPVETVEAVVTSDKMEIETDNVAAVAAAAPEPVPVPEQKEDHTHWSLHKLFVAGTLLALTADDCPEWPEIARMYEALHTLTSASIDLFTLGTADCSQLLWIESNLDSGARIFDIVRFCMQSSQRNQEEDADTSLQETATKVRALCQRVKTLTRFYEQHFNADTLSFAHLQSMSCELELLSHCIRKESVPYAAEIESTLADMHKLVATLEALFASRPYATKCALAPWINFLFLQFNVMYRNQGHLQMRDYRDNAANTAYCFCRFSYGNDDDDHNHNSNGGGEVVIPDMLGCRACGEWFHPECVMLDEKQVKKLNNTKKTKFICPRCEYFEHNEAYAYFPSLHWTADLVLLSDLQQTLDAAPMLCSCDLVNGVQRLVSWMKTWQNDVNRFIDALCDTHTHLSDFTEQDIFMAEFLLNCGQISGVSCDELVMLKILMRFIGKSAIWNNHSAVRQFQLHEMPLDVIEKVLWPKYQHRCQLFADFIASIMDDIRHCKEFLLDQYVDLYLMERIGRHYTQHMRRKKKGPARVKLILARLERVLHLELQQCPQLLENKSSLDLEGEQYVTSQFENNNEWLKYVNDSISMKKSDKVVYHKKWYERLKTYQDALLNKYKNARLQIGSVVLTVDLLQKLMEG